MRARKNKTFVFRRYKKIEGGKSKRAKHPKLIVDSNKYQYGFMGLTESKKSGHHTNIDLYDNPEFDTKNKKRKTYKSYIRKELRYDNKENFSEVLNNYNLSYRDKMRIIEYLKNKKR